MIPKGLFTQIGMVIISVAIIITYVKPAFSDIGEVQSQIEAYQKQNEQVEAVNQKLRTLVSRMDNTPTRDEERLYTYMPDSVDSIHIPRDLYLIVKQAGLLYRDVTYAKVQNYRVPTDPRTGQPLNMPKPHSFSLSVEGTYNQVKTFLTLLEQNNYPFEIHDLSIKRIDGGFLSADFEIMTYEYMSSEISS
ncbi:MAG: hypothetical protein KC877_00825 [Candidatus Kaiserbacteria bacterium]|nr:hypothetical protein [Candidatus Kaiserbacteria bacterium]MCB9816834.1 hypothetical protein [Candidatus Nomurabacteria bacterium]